MRYIKIIAIALNVTLIASCTKKFDEINTSPVLVSADIIQPSMLFTAALKNSIFSSYENSIFKEYSNYFTNEASGTIFQDRDWSAPFSDYQGTLINIAEVVRLTSKDPLLANENAMARIWKVWLFHQMTDAYGDLPYSEALLGVDNVINQPKYDMQKDIYADMLKELDEAAAGFAPVC